MLSENSNWNLQMFFRYTITGTVIIFWLVLGLPSHLFSQTDKYPTLSTLLTAFLALLIPFFGWIAYHLLYPCWRWILSRPLSTLNLYPKSLVHQTIEEIVDLANDLISPKDLWSYFLWQYAEVSIRRRIKMLADAGHSLYIGSFTLIVFPLLNLGIKLCFPYNALLDSLIVLAIPNQSTFPAPMMIEWSLAIGCFLVGVGLIIVGKHRITYAQNIQWILLKDNEPKIKQLSCAIKSNRNKTPAR